MKKNISILLILPLLLMNLIGCGMKREDLIASVREYPISSENFPEIRNVYDFEKKVENFEEEDTKLLTIVCTTYDVTPFEKENEDSFIYNLNKTSEFNYDNKKQYVRLKIWGSFYSEKTSRNIR